MGQSGAAVLPGSAGRGHDMRYVSPLCLQVLELERRWERLPGVFARGLAREPLDFQVPPRVLVSR